MFTKNFLLKSSTPLSRFCSVFLFIETKQKREKRVDDFEREYFVYKGTVIYFKPKDLFELENKHDISLKKTLKLSMWWLFSITEYIIQVYYY